MFDPNEAVEELREAYNGVQDGTLTLEQAELLIVLFDDLDTHLMNGGELPDDWNL